MPAVLKNPIEDGLGKIRVVEDPPQALRGLLVVKSIGRRCRQRSLTTWNSTLAASGP